MKKERNKTVPAVYLILKRNNAIILGRRQNSGYYDGWYSLPAGHVEATELPVSALVREVKEEIGIDLNPEDIRLTHTMYRTAHDETGDRSDYFFTVEKWNEEPKIMEPDKCDDLNWFPINQLPEKTVHYIKDVIQKIEKGIQYSEIDLEHSVQNPTKSI